MGRRRSIVPTAWLLVVAVFALRPAGARAAEPQLPVPDALPTVHSRLWLHGAELAVVATAWPLDRHIRDNVRLAGGAGGERVSDAVKPLGTGRVVFPALLLWAAASHFAGHDDQVGASARIAASVGVAVVTSDILKYSVGRERPFESPTDAGALRPFSRHASFPSGHATLAFAAATALDRETQARWVPWVVYPLAGAVGWSRLRDDRHWTSDVLAGAVMGLWVGGTTDRLLQAHPNVLRRLHVPVAIRLAPGGLGIAAAF